MKNKKRKYIYNDDSDSEKENENVKSINNNIYFYCPVNLKNVLKLNTFLEDIQNKIYKNEIIEKEINVYIHSGGGDLFAGISAMNYIQNMKLTVNTIVDGYAASSATLILLGGHQIYMQKYATLLIHQLSTGFYGKYEECIDEVNNSKITMNMLKKIYEEKTNIPEENLKAYFKKDIYIEADECLKFNIIHQIY